MDKKLEDGKMLQMSGLKYMMRSYGMIDFASRLKACHSQYEKLVDKYSSKKRMEMMPVSINVGFEITLHDKMPDVLLYRAETDWIYFCATQG